MSSALDKPQQQSTSAGDAELVAKRYASARDSLPSARTFAELFAAMRAVMPACSAAITASHAAFDAASATLFAGQTLSNVIEREPFDARMHALQAANVAMNNWAGVRFILFLRTK